MLLTKEVEVNLNNNIIKYYENLGYKISKKQHSQQKHILVYDLSVPLLVKVEDLPKGSNILVDIKCDCPDCKNPYLKPVKWNVYTRYIHEDGKYYCNSCAHTLFAGENIKKSKLKNGKSFETWCIENNRYDILNRFDYELNDCLPSDITYRVNNKYYFKCTKEIHKSELKCIASFTGGSDGSMNCKACNSFAQWGIDNLGEDFLEKYWDYNKNNELGINPWEISYGSKNTVYIFCQIVKYHDSYPVQCSSFTCQNVRCSFCHGKSVHELNSLGYLYPEVLEIWSDKNKKSSFEYMPNARQKVWWKCPEGIHEDYFRIINDSNTCNFRCPECQYSRGEERICNYFIHNKIDYISQKEFDGLLGINNGLLSYDFYLPQYNLLIEYQGEQHEKYIPGFYKSKKDFKRQLEHDRRKKEYAKNNNINLLEIWYWDYDNIENILIKELKLCENYK